MKTNLMQKLSKIFKNYDELSERDMLEINLREWFIDEISYQFEEDITFDEKKFREMVYRGD